MTEVEFRLLGAMQQRVEDAPVTLPGAAERGALALLLLSPGRTVAASSLIDRRWSEPALPADPLNARAAAGRRCVGRSPRTASTSSSGRHSDTASTSNPLDPHRFVSSVRAARTATRSTAGGDALALYDEALAQWRDDPVADFAGRGWATVEAARLDQLHQHALTERAEAVLVAGRHVEVVAVLLKKPADSPATSADSELLAAWQHRTSGTPSGWRGDPRAAPAPILPGSSERRGAMTSTRVLAELGERIAEAGRLRGPVDQRYRVVAGICGDRCGCVRT